MILRRRIGHNENSILFLDDEHRRFTALYEQLYGEIVNEDVFLEWAETAQQAINKLKESKYDIVCLDHDLGGETYVTRVEGTGYEVALWMEHYLPKDNIPDFIWIHSWNMDGSKRMAQAIEGIEGGQFRIARSPFNAKTIHPILALVERNRNEYD